MTIMQDPIVSYSLVTFASFMAISLVCLKYPKLVFWQKPKKWNNPLLIKAMNKEIVLNLAHRGGSRGRLENTIESFENGLRCGANVLEMDVCLTKDKKIVVIHDDLLLRMCGVHKYVQEFNYKDLPPFQDEIILDFSVSGRSYKKDSQTPYIPLLEDVFKKFPSVIINVEIKTPTQEFVDLMDDLIRRYEREDITIWGCKNTPMSNQLKKANPRVKRFFSLKELGNLYLRYFTGLIPFCSINEDSLQIPIYNWEHFEWKRRQQNSFLQHLEHRIYFLMIRFLTCQIVSGMLFSHLRSRGVAVIFWVINDEADFERCINYNGCIGIMTDLPSQLTSFLNKHKLYRKE